MENTTSQVNKIYPAFIKAQAKFDSAKKDKTNPAYKSKYATLQSVTDAIREILAENELAYIQIPKNGVALNSVTVETRVIHSSGQEIVSEFSLPVNTNNAQAVGSAITYARRYALMCIFGIPTEDDDGNSAVGKDDFKQDEKPPKIVQLEKSEQKVIEPTLQDENSANFDTLIKGINAKKTIEELEVALGNDKFNRLFDSLTDNAKGTFNLNLAQCRIKLKDA